MRIKITRSACQCKDLEFVYTFCVFILLNHSAHLFSLNQMLILQFKILIVCQWSKLLSDQPPASPRITRTLKEKIIFIGLLICGMCYADYIQHWGNLFICFLSFFL